MAWLDRSSGRHARRPCTGPEGRLLRRPPGARPLSFSWKNLSRIEDPVRIERLLHALHERNLLVRQLDWQEPRLREPDPVLAADRALERDDALEQHAFGLVRARDFGGIR